MRKALTLSASFALGSMASVLGFAALAVHVYRDSELGRIAPEDDLGPARSWGEDRFNQRTVPRVLTP